MANILILSGNINPADKSEWTNLVVGWLQEAGHSPIEGVVSSALPATLESADLVLLGNANVATNETLVPNRSTRRKVIVLNPGCGRISSFRKLFQMGFRDVAPKPYSQEGLLELVTESFQLIKQRD